MAANAAVSALAAQAGLTVEQLEFHSGITGAELKKRLIKGEYDEGLATDAARNARLWDEGMAAYTAPVYPPSALAPRMLSNLVFGFTKRVPTVRRRA